MLESRTHPGRPRTSCLRPGQPRVATKGFGRPRVASYRLASLCLEVRRRRYTICIVLSNYPLGTYDDDGEPLNKLEQLSVTGLYQVLIHSSKPQIVDVRSQGDRVVGAQGLLVCVDGAPATEGVFPSDGQVPDLDDDVPLSRIAQNLERIEGALCQSLACGGSVGDASIRIKPGGKSFAGPTYPLPTSRGKGKVERYVGGPSDDSSGHARAKEGSAFGHGCPKPQLGSRLSHGVENPGGSL
uniref:Uncharacterized protein n=1 Tax=Cannabis sativa TaxID=3483 RepID=A0A803P421_CANSA